MDIGTFSDVAACKQLPESYIRDKLSYTLASCPATEWAKDDTGKLYIVQARPETVRSRQDSGALSQTTVTGQGETVIEGTAIGSDAAVGQARVIRNLAEIAEMKRGDILVADMTDPDWVPAIRAS